MLHVHSDVKAKCFISCHSNNYFQSPTPSSITQLDMQLSQTGGLTVLMSLATTRVSMGSGCHVITECINALLQLRTKSNLLGLLPKRDNDQ